MAVSLDADTLHRYRRFSLYNSPFAAHGDGSAIDLYPPAEGDTVPSPVSGEITAIRRVRAPPQPYAAEHDYLIVVDTGSHNARLLHVDPEVEVGDRLTAGDALGAPIRAGFFAPWVPNHLHLEFRDRDANPFRASGSSRLAVDVPIAAVAWDGTGTVAETGETWARLDAPSHPAPGDQFAGLAVDLDVEGGAKGEGIVDDAGVLDGGLPHYDHGGVLGREPVGTDGDWRPVSLAGHRVGRRRARTVDWDDLTVLANGEPGRGIACYVDRHDVGVKLVGQNVSLEPGEAVSVTVRRA